VSSGTAVAVTLAATAGLAGSVQAAVMGELGERVGIVPAVAFSVVVVFLLGLAALLIWERSLAGIRDTLHEPAWLWVGGLMSIYIVFAVTVGPPRIGVTATVGIVIAGNLLSAALIDRYGLLGQDVIPIDRWRLLGLVLLALGSILSLSRT
jgi:bacterial/archaeal transporter family-2 protein